MTPKNDEIGYYSLIQYCPNEMIGEVANIGVLLFVPKTGFVDVRVTPTNQRIAHIFGGGIHKYDTLQRYKDGLAEWVKVEHRKFQSLENAKSFFAANANTIVFSPIRGTVCPEGAEKTLDALYAEFFSRETIQPESPTPKAPKAPRFSSRRFFSTLRKKYGKDVDNKIAILPAFEIVGIEQRIKPAFAFQNEHFHIVFSQSFSPKHCGEQIGFGLLLSQEMGIARKQLWQASVPIILGRFAPSDRDLARHVMKTFKRHGIPFYDNEQTLTDYIAKEIKDLPAFARQYAASRMSYLKL